MSKATFRDSFLPENLANADDLEKRDARLLITMLLTAAVGSFLYEFYAYKLGLFYLNILLTLNIVLYAISLIIFKKTANKLISGHLFIFSTYLLFCGIYIAGDGSQSPGVVWFILFPLMAFSATGTKHGILWTIVSSSSAIFISIYMRSNNIEMGVYTDETRHTATIVNLVLNPAILIVMTKYGFDSKERAIKLSETKKKEALELLNDRNKLLSVLFHDLSNPLMVVLGKSYYC